MEVMLSIPLSFMQGLSNSGNLAIDSTNGQKNCLSIWDVQQRYEVQPVEFNVSSVFLDGHSVFINDHLVMVHSGTARQ